MRWKKLLSHKELGELVEFAISVKQNPEKYLPSRQPSRNVNKPRTNFVNDEVIKQLTKKFSLDEDNKRAAMCEPKTSRNPENKDTIKQSKKVSKDVPQRPTTCKPTKLCYNEKTSDEPNRLIHGELKLIWVFLKLVTIFRITVLYEYL